MAGKFSQTPRAAGSQMILWSCAWMRTFWRFLSFMKSTMSDILILPKTGLRKTSQGRVFPDDAHGALQVLPGADDELQHVLLPERGEAPLLHHFLHA